MTSDPKREVHFGILALQFGFISREQFLAAAKLWLPDESPPLDELLRVQNALAEEDRKILWAMIDRLIENHNSDVSKSLVSLSSLLSDSVLAIVNEMVLAIPPEIGATLSLVIDGRGNGAETVELSLPEVTTHAGPMRQRGSRFRILRPHARGGLGEISVAEDVELHREIALKEIQARYADDPMSRLRFVLEAEVTGGLEHPGIVPVYGLGQHEDGRPFYAMRFIHGDSLQDAIAAFHSPRLAVSAENVVVNKSEKANHNLQLRKLLGRFIDVCMAISYAHSRGVLHRDLKPGNVMLGKYGETLVVDWGLAKVLGGNDAETSGGTKLLQPASGSGITPTIMGSAVGTPAYMPPEQAAGNLDDLGPASDVYSLGATLYHLLTGLAPFRGRDLATTLVNVRSGKFPRPREACPQVPLPLEAVCLKAMALRPEDRYASPSDLAEEVERFLADEPVSAHRDSFLIRLRRWSRKHPRSIAALAATLLVGLTSSLVIAVVVAGKNQQLAIKNNELAEANNAERLAKEFAELKQMESETATNYMVDAFRKADPSEDGLETKVVDVIDQAVEALEIEFADDSLLKAKLLNAFGQTYRGIGLPHEFLATMQKAFDLRRAQLGENHEDTLTSMSQLASAHEEVGDIATALKIHQDCFARLQASLGENHTKSLSAMNNLGLVLDQAGNTEEALRLLQECLDKKRDVLGASDPSTLTTWNNLATCYVSAGDFTAALEIQKQCLELTIAALGEKHVDSLTAMHNLALTFKRSGDLDESIRLNEICLQTRMEILGEEHPHTLSTMNNLAVAYKTSGFHEKALPLYERSYEAKQRKLGDDHPSTLSSLNNLALIFRSTGDVQKALSLSQQCWERSSAVRGADHPSTLLYLNNLAVAHSFAGQPEQSLPLVEKCLELTLNKLGETHPQTLLAMNNLASEYRKQGQVDKSLQMHLRCLDLRETNLGKDHPDTLDTLNELAYDYKTLGEIAKAIPYYLQCLELRRTKLGEEHPQTIDSLNNLAIAYDAANELELALPLYEESQRKYLSKFGESHSFTLTSLDNLGNAFRKSGRIADSLRTHQQCLEGRRKALGADHQDTLRSIDNLTKSYVANEQTSLGIALINEYLGTRRERGLDDNAGLANFLANISLTLCDAKEFSEAERHLRRCFQIREREEPDNWRIFYTRLALGSVILEQDRQQQLSEAQSTARIAEAKQFLLDGYAGLMQRRASMTLPLKERVAETLEQLIQLFEASQQTATAELWRSKLSEWKSPAPH